MKWKPVKQISDFKRGMIVGHVQGGDSLVVTSNYGDHAIAVKTQHIANPTEWVIFDHKDEETDDE